MYRKLHYECGIIGQLLYNEAFAVGLKATGLGCFVDDVAMEDFGLDNTCIQTLYHFTIGVPIEDCRYPTFNYEVPMTATFELDE